MKKRVTASPRHRVSASSPAPRLKVSASSPAPRPRVSASSPRPRLSESVSRRPSLPDSIYRIAAETMAEGAAAVSPDGRMIFCNPRLGEFLQMPCESLLGRLFANFVAVDDRARFAELMEQAKAGPVRGRIDVVGAAGRALPLQVSASPLSMPDGVGVCIVATDLTEVEDAVRKLERARLEHEALRDSALRLRNALAGAAVGLAITSLDGRFAEANDSYCRIVGYSADELRLLTYQQLIYPEDYAEDARLAAELAAGQIDCFVIENRYVRKNGELIWVRKSISKVRDLSNAVQGYIGFVEDISEQKRSEQSLRESEERFRSVLDNSRDVIIRLNLQLGRFEYVSPSCESLVGYTAEELTAMPGEQTIVMVHPDDLPALREAIARCEARGEAEAEYRQRRKDGSYVWVSNRMSDTRDAAGRPLYRSLSLRDITERKRAEEELRESEARFRLALKNSPVSVAVQDRDLKFTWAFNHRSATPDQIIGHFDHEIFTADEAARITAFKRRVLDLGIEQHERMWLDRPTGRMYVDICWEPLRDTTGNVVGVASATLDMTSLKLAEDESKRQLDELQRWQDVMLDREDRVMELKREVNELLRRHGEPIRYASQAEEDTETRGRGLDAETRGHGDEGDAETRRRGEGGKE